MKTSNQFKEGRTNAQATVTTDLDEVVRVKLFVHPES
jgi:hypothetical protein